ncbi:hypothetical protein [Candidatus Cyanaurora vandensis]|uniref:hypothetical protein n=1 Tax=Candidatus Cyanaurora vandensis TaxID=2714958 RepID=UPI00257D5584|nr:hypothetical protein [Candidatus Cyanaurora vandensis]
MGEVVSHEYLTHTHERYTLIAIKDGLVLKQVVLSAKELGVYYKSQLKAFKRTAAYAAKLKESKSYEDEAVYSDEFTEYLLYQFKSDSTIPANKKTSGRPADKNPPVP